jgi:hypothetical protein
MVPMRCRYAQRAQRVSTGCVRTVPCLWWGLWVDGWVGGWVDGWMDLWMDGWMDLRMDGWVDLTPLSLKNGC